MRLTVTCCLALIGVACALPGDFARSSTPGRPDADLFSAADRSRSILFESDSNLTSTSLWPRPMNQTFPHHHTYYINPDQFIFSAVGPAATSDILAEAFNRYHPLCFPWGAGKPANIPAVSPDQSTYLMTTLTVDVASDSDYLGLTTDESYTLNITDDGTVVTATLSAPTIYGALRGLETFSQLIAYEMNLQYYQTGTTLVVDKPRYPYRGVMVDVARHYISVSTLLDTIDAMAYHKFNVLHLHLIDTQSWPLVIDAYPRLTGWAAFSNFSHIYTKDDVANIVQHAKYRGIRVIPEIDTPSHSDVIKKAYPDILTLINCDGSDCPKGETFRSMPDPTKNETWVFLTNIFREVGEMFPDEAFHIGGDEWWPAWNNAPTVQAFMKEEGYTSIYDVYHYYERHVIDIVRTLGKKTIVAWEDIHGFQEAHEGDNTTYELYPDVVLDVWAGWVGNGGSWQKNFEQYTSKNASVILTGPWYIDSKSQHIYDTLWTQFYATDPANWTGNAQQQEKVLGGHVCAWDDAINGDSADLLTLLFPSSAAVAEVLWSQQWIVDEHEAKDRMIGHRCRLVQREVPAGPVEIGFCPIEYQSKPIGPVVPASSDRAAEVDADAKIAALQAKIAELQQENDRLARRSVVSA